MTGLKGFKFGDLKSFERTGEPSQQVYSKSKHKRTLPNLWNQIKNQNLKNKFRNI